MAIGRKAKTVTISWNDFCNLFSDASIDGTCHFDVSGGSITIEKHGKFARLTIARGDEKESFDILIPNMLECKVYEYVEIKDLVFKPKKMEYASATVECESDIFKFRVNVGKVPTLKLEVTEVSRKTVETRIPKSSTLAQTVVRLSKAAGTYDIHFKLKKELSTGEKLKKPYLTFETPEMREED